MPRMSLSDFSPAAFKKLRLKSGMSITDLAIAAKLSRGAISKWENGVAKPTPENFVKAMKILDADPDTVVPNKGEHSTLFDLRAQAGLSRAQVEQALDISRSTWGDIERGTARLSKTRAATLAALFQVPEHLVTTAAANTLQI